MAARAGPAVVPRADGDRGVAPYAGRVRELEATLRRHPVAVDAVLALVLGGPLVLLGAAVAPAPPAATALALLLGAAMVVPLALRRVVPGWVIAAQCAVGVVQLFADPTIGGSPFPLPADAAFAVGLYTLTARARTPVGRWGALPVGLAASVLCTLAWRVPGYLVVLVLTVVVAFVSGTLRRVRAAYVAGLVDRAEQAETGREQQVRLAESAERARIAREMHDVVAHSLSVIIVQADGGAYVARQDPDRAVEVLRTISGTGREALTQMRHLLGVLREDPAAGTPAAPSAPQPGLADLAGLVGQVGATGLPVHARLPTPAEVADVPAATALVAYRVVQECLTNVLKHAGRVGRVEVGVQRVADRLRLEVSDDGRGAAASLGSTPPGAAPERPVSDEPGGQGLRGMQERVALLGGRLVAGPRQGGGFRTVATLPLPAPAGPAVPVWVAPTARPRGPDTSAPAPTPTPTPTPTPAAPALAPVPAGAWRTWEPDRRGPRWRRR